MSSIRKKNPETKRKILEFVNEFFVENHRSPSMNDIATEIGVSKSTAFAYITELKDEGKIDYNGKTIVTDLIRKADVSTQLAPVVGRIACGSPTMSEEDFEEFVALPISLFGKGDFFILRADGDSMIDAGIDDGDMVVIERGKCAAEGDIVAFMTKEYDATLKRIHFNTNGSILLHPENSRFKDIIIKDPTDCTIIGVAHHVIKKL